MVKKKKTSKKTSKTKKELYRVIKCSYSEPQCYERQIEDLTSKTKKELYRVIKCSYSEPQCYERQIEDLTRERNMLRLKLLNAGITLK